MSSYELATKIFNSLSDGYDDEEYREEYVKDLYNELSQIPGDSIIRSALIALCDRVEDLEA